MDKKTPLKRRTSTSKEEYDRLKRERTYLTGRCVIYRQETIEENIRQSKLLCGKHLPLPIKPLSDETIREARSELKSMSDITEADFNRLLIISQRAGYDYTRLVHNINNLQKLLRQKGINKRKDIRFAMAIKITHPEIGVKTIADMIGIGSGTLHLFKKDLEEWGYDVS